MQRARCHSLRETGRHCVSAPGKNGPGSDHERPANVLGSGVRGFVRVAGQHTEPFYGNAANVLALGIFSTCPGLILSGSES
jgi:hypothetical protein